MKRFCVLSLTLLALAATTPLFAQQGIFNHKDDKPKFSTPLPYRIFHLSSMTEQANANEVLSAVRRVIDSESVSLMGIQNDLLVIGSPEQLNAAADIIAALDKPRPLYHLSFTVTETDAGRRAVRHYSLYATGGQETQLKSTRWIPVSPPPSTDAATDKAAPNSAERFAPPKVEHIEAGMHFQVLLDEYAGGVRLQSTITDSSLPAEPPPPGTTNPIIEQNELQNTSLLKWGKPILLGVIDPPNTTRHIEIEVVADQQLP